MNISIFSKFDMAGGSEFRCIELANGIGKFTEHKSFLLSEKRLPPVLHERIDPNVTVVENCFLSPNHFYESDCIIVVNTDTPCFSTLDYWTGKSPRHSFSLDMSRFKNKKMFFLYNFIVSPSKNLYQLKELGIDVYILTTNTKFFEEISKQDRYENIRALPRYTLESPIDQTKLNISVRCPKDKVCFGMHSKSLGNKWNDELRKLILDVNKRYTKEQVEFRFMGIKGNLRSQIEKIENVTCLKENEESVQDFVSKLDIFLFFPDWKREEPWARVIAEAMVSGCPVIALDKGGTSDQVLKYNNGFLCKDYGDYYNYIVYMLEHKDIIEVMSKNSIRISKNFYTESVIKKLMGFINN